jgi:branched-chain amino acid transport system substrate-binding protein
VLARFLVHALAAVVLAAVCLGGSAALASDPIKVGLSLGLTGGNAPYGKQLLVALEIWRDDVNADGGILGRPVQLTCYDDQSAPSNVPAIYTKLIEVDRVDLLLGPYGTNQIAAALPVVAQQGLATIGILGLAANQQLHYDRYFSMVPIGQDPKREFSRGFFDMAVAQNPRPRTVAITGADAEFGKNATDGARENAAAAGLSIVYDQRYPPGMIDLTPLVRAIKAADPDIVFVAAYPPDTVGFVRAVSEVGLSPKMIGGAMLGLMATPLKMQMGPLMNGYVNNADVFVPTPSFNFAGVQELLRKYQQRAKSEGIDPLGYNFMPYAYAAAQVLRTAVEKTGSLDQGKLAAYMHSHSFATVVGEVAFGRDGEWVNPRMLVTQWQHLEGNDLAQLTDLSKWVVLWPPQHKTGELIYPFSAARKSQLP